MVTLKEIADKAGVSIGTVDRVLHNRGRVSKENIALILRIARENGYVPNQLARRLQDNRQYSFGVLLPALESEFGYWQQIKEGIETARTELNSLEVDIIYSFYDRRSPDDFLAACEHLFANDISAYIMAPLMGDATRRVMGDHGSVPAVFIDSSLPGISPLYDLSQDPEQAGRTAARVMDLFDSSLDSVFTIQTYSSAYNGRMRAEAFLNAYRAVHDDVPTASINIATEDDFAIIPDMVGRSGRVGLFVVNDGVHRIVDAIKSSDDISRFTIIGFDLSPQNRELLDSGLIAAVIGQRPRLQGYEAAMFLYRAIVLGQERRSVHIPVDIYIKENIPESEHWL